MRNIQWNEIKNFTPDDFGCEDMDSVLIYTLQDMRDYVNGPIVIHCGYEERIDGYHPKKCAIDFHIKFLYLNSALLNLLIIH